MFAAFASSINADDPLSALAVSDRPEPPLVHGWTTVRMRAASLNHHDLWSLRGVGLAADRLPMILGCDAVGLDEDGNHVIIYPIVTEGSVGGDETMDRTRTILSEKYQGTFAEYVSVPRRNLVPMPDGWSWEQAACLPTAWLTAYRMLAVRSGLKPGNTVLVQGAGGGVSTACIALARAMGLRVWATSRDEAKRAKSLAIGAHAAFEPGQRLPDRVDAVMETVGQATWSHSLKALRPGGVIVVSGATSGPNPPADLARVFFLQLSVVGSTMGTLQDLHDLVALCSVSGVRPIIDAEIPLREARTAFERLAAGDVFGKIVLTNQTN
ncbi:MAG: zinc-binding dehydrogenase [Actinomycetes bacterium]